MTNDAVVHGERKVYSVAAFNTRLAGYVRRVRDVWVEGELSELRRNDAWATVFLTLKDRETGACLHAQMQRRRFDALGLELADGEAVQALGRLDLFEARGELVFRIGELERVGSGDHLAALERLKRILAAEGLFATERKRPLPRFPRAIGLLTGTIAAARGDVLAAIGSRFPATRVVVAETRVQGAGAADAIVASLVALAQRPGVDVVIVARGGGSLEDLLPFSDERVVRAIAACAVPVVSAVGHEQDTPLCDLAADVRAATPTAAARLVVPDHAELERWLAAIRARCAAAVSVRLDRDRARLDDRRLRLRHTIDARVGRDRERLARAGERLALAPRRIVERRRSSLDLSAARLQALSPHATLARGYAIVRAGSAALREATAVAPGAAIDVQLAVGGLGARVVEVRE